MATLFGLMLVDGGFFALGFGMVFGEFCAQFFVDMVFAVLVLQPLFDMMFAPDLVHLFAGMF